MARDIVKTLPLTHPVTHGGTVYEKLEFEKPRGKHFRPMTLTVDPVTGQPIMRMGALLDVAAAMCAVPPQVIDDLEGADLFAVFAVVQGFMPAGLRTG